MNPVFYFPLADVPKVSIENDFPGSNVPKLFKFSLQIG